jgi:hypothetical protein
MNGCLAGCHAALAPADARYFSNETQARAFALARSSNNNLNSLFLQKPSGAVAHSGGTVWSPVPAGTGHAGYNAAVAWINGGRGN